LRVEKFERTQIRCYELRKNLHQKYASNSTRPTTRAFGVMNHLL